MMEHVDTLLPEDFLNYPSNDTDQLSTVMENFNENSARPEYQELTNVLPARHKSSANNSINSK